MDNGQFSEFFILFFIFFCIGDKFDMMLNCLVPIHCLALSQLVSATFGQMQMYNKLLKTITESLAFLVWLLFFFFKKL